MENNHKTPQQQHFCNCHKIFLKKSKEERKEDVISLRLKTTQKAYFENKMPFQQEGQGG